jgi:hypothetical protein
MGALFRGRDAVRISSLIPMRALVASGDERALYLAWLLGVQYGEIDEGATEPSRPDGLGTLPPALENFVDIVGLDPDLVTAAAEGMAPTSPALSAKSLDRWIATLTEREKAALLSRVARGETGVGSELLHRFRRQHALPRSASAGLRTVVALVARSGAIAERRRQAAVERETKERTRRDDGGEPAVEAKRRFAVAGGSPVNLDAHIRSLLSGAYHSAPPFGARECVRHCAVL